MLSTHEILKWRQQQSGLNRLMNMQITELTEGHAEVTLALSPALLNPLGMAHGGTIYSLCDVAAGTAAASRGRVAVTLNSSTNYLRPGKPDRTLRAVATERKAGRTTGVFLVEVFDDRGEHVADATFTMYYTGQTLEDMICPVED
ncbi:PaaI family thioesterase [Butyricicoccus faecihominis]|uniref:PaaI family thioesterase n=1 Tax=Butyricicoccaceae TaxID=3085642 RepID=UPI0024792FF2|nr:MULTISPECIES: PaaI family thioesterase [Butyricicoccaceae]MCQ5128133.1 PaaI family thioesterase [Butyricicoccus faecihominis]WNX86436.1 PaaI family thioesterase [Agathobaculum sp. NTUH-O15-33]